LIETIGRIINAPRSRLDKARGGLMKILGREEEAAEDALKIANEKQAAMVKKLDQYNEADYEPTDKPTAERPEPDDEESEGAPRKAEGGAKKKNKKPLKEKQKDA
jgi:hypothetical protein